MMKNSFTKVLENLIIVSLAAITTVQLVNQVVIEKLIDTVKNLRVVEYMKLPHDSFLEKPIRSILKVFSITAALFSFSSTS